MTHTSFFRLAVVMVGLPLVLACVFLSSTTHSLGIQVTIPNGWLPLRINEREFIDAWANEAVVNSTILGALNRMSQLDPQYVRLVAFDIQPDHRPDLVESNVMILTGHPSSLEELPKLHLDSLKEKHPDLKIISSQTGEVASLPAATLEYTYGAVDLRSGKEDKIYKKIVFFSANGKVFSIVFTTEMELKEMIFPQAEQIIDSLVVFESDYGE